MMRINWKNSPKMRGDMSEYVYVVTRSDEANGKMKGCCDWHPAKHGWKCFGSNVEKICNMGIPMCLLQNSPSSLSSALPKNLRRIGKSCNEFRPEFSDNPMTMIVTRNRATRRDVGVGTFGG
jgi:hypothetical protein